MRDELEQLRKAHAVAKPSARLGAIRQRLARADGEAAAVRLVTVLSAVEALARSLVVHAPGRPAATSPFRYRQVLHKAPMDLVEEALRLHGGAAAVPLFGEAAWQLFGLAHQARHLVVHECTQLPHDTYPPLITACERVLEGLVDAGGLLRVVAARA